MSILENISFGFGNKIRLILQTESAECGLACLAMISSYYGSIIDLATLRRKYPISLKGATLANLMQIANSLKLTSRPLKLELDDLSLLKCPCILHWNMNHFVVLSKATATNIVIHDPAFGERKLKLNEVSKSFTGVALELWPNPGFETQNQFVDLKIRTLFGHITGLYRFFAQILALAVVLEIISIISPLLMQWVIDNVITSNDLDLLNILAIGFSILLLIRITVSAFRSWAAIYMGISLNVQWRTNIFTHLFLLPVDYFNKRHLGDIVSRFGSIDQIQQTLTSSFLESVIDGVMSIITLTMMYIYSPLLCLVSFAAMFLYGIVRLIFFQPLRAASMEQIVHSAKQQTHFLETIRGIRSLKLFQRHDERRSSWLGLFVEQINAGIKIQKLGLIFKLLNSLIFGFENILIIWLGAKQVMAGNFTIGVLMAFNAYRGNFDGRVSNLIDKYFEVKMLQLHCERLADIVMSDTEVSEIRLLYSDSDTPCPTIEIINLSFRYSDDDPWILEGINFTIAPGESLAITGPSGCGKTTLVNLMLGILKPTDGDIRIDGVSIYQTGIENLRRIVGTVLQDDVLFAGSIADNICFFDNQTDQLWIENCAKLAAIHQDICLMPMGYNTLVGDMGTVLSGGQKQRVLLARALYKKPRILFLDEATSHLDVEREKQVNSAIKSLDITRVIVAHRNETIASANRLIAIENGKIKGEATIAPGFGRKGLQVIS